VRYLLSSPSPSCTTSTLLRSLYYTHEQSVCATFSVPQVRLVLRPLYYVHFTTHLNSRCALPSQFPKSVLHYVHFTTQTTDEPRARWRELKPLEQPALAKALEQPARTPSQFPKSVCATFTALLNFTTVHCTGLCDCGGRLLPVYVSSYYICVLIPDYICPHTTIHVSGMANGCLGWSGARDWRLAILTCADAC
jgi:hypothetical protein